MSEQGLPKARGLGAEKVDCAQDEHLDPQDCGSLRAVRFLDEFVR